MAHLVAADVLRKGTKQAHAHLNSCRWSSVSQRLSSLGVVPDQDKAHTPSLLSRSPGKHSPAQVQSSDSQGAEEHDPRDPGYPFPHPSGARVCGQKANTPSHPGCLLSHPSAASICGQKANTHSRLQLGFQDILGSASASRGQAGPSWDAWLRGSHTGPCLGLTNQCARVAFAADARGCVPGFARGFALTAKSERPEGRSRSLTPPSCPTSGRENRNQRFALSSRGDPRPSPTLSRQGSPSSLVGREMAGGTGNPAAVFVPMLAARRGVRGACCSHGALVAELAGPAGGLMLLASVHTLPGRHSVRDLYWPHGSSACSPPQLQAQRHTPVMPLHLDFNQDVRIMEANSVLQRMQVLQFREHLEDISEEQHTISHAQLVSLCRDSGAAATRAEAERVCEALNMAGIVLRYRDVVYLRPSEVSEIILEALPDTFSDLNAKLQNLRQVLEPLEKHKMEVDRKARRFSTIMLRCGFVLLFVQWAIFVRLTFWDLGWDFMEPITYYTTTFVGLVAYAYYLNYRRSFDFQSMDHHLTSDLQEKGYAAKGIDMARYKRLQRDIERYERYLQHLKERPGMVAGRPSGLDGLQD